MKIVYKKQQFYSKPKTMIQRANDIIEEYLALGFDLTIRQLHYQFVTRDLGPNTLKHYTQLRRTISNARLAGMVDWLAIVDRTRYTRELSHWDNEAGIIFDAAQQFRIDKWERQAYRPRIWIEKDALIGVISETCEELDTPYFSTRGFPSNSEVWANSQGFINEAKNGQIPIIIHLSDHDPSGLDMTRDVEDKMILFRAIDTQVKRIGLTLDQVNEHNPPPNFAKEKDTRWPKYHKLYGPLSWELDALDPITLTNLIRNSILDYRDEDIWAEDIEREKVSRDILKDLSHNLADVKEFLNSFNGNGSQS